MTGQNIIAEGRLGVTGCRAVELPSPRLLRELGRSLKVNPFDGAILPPCIRLKK